MIPLADLKTQYHSIKSEIDAAIQGVLDNSAFILGKEVAAFEKDFAEYCDSAQAIGVNSGTSALHLALLACDIGPGDEVITVPFTFIATVSAIGYCGATPVFVDVEPGTLNMDPSKLERAITPRTKAIMPVHLFGQCADMDPILAIASRYGLRIVEDAAQAHGARYKGRAAGSMGDLGCFSFYPGKNLGAFGEGGAVTTSQPELARKVRLLRDWGMEDRYHYVARGFNYRMEGFQGAILRVKLRHLNRWTEQRQANAARYTEALAGSALRTPVTGPHNTHVFHQYTLRSKDRATVQKKLADAGVATAIHYPVPLHLLDIWKGHGNRGDFPESELAAQEIFSIPVHPELTSDQVGCVLEVLKSAIV